MLEVGWMCTGMLVWRSGAQDRMESKKISPLLYVAYLPCRLPMASKECKIVFYTAQHKTGPLVHALTGVW